MRIRKNNQGLSIVEVIIVVAIMGILVGLLSPAISLLFSKDARQSAEIIQGELDKIRSYSISKQGDWSLEINNDGTNYVIEIYKDGAVIESTKLSKYITVDPDVFGVTFVASSGAVSQVKDSTGTYVTPSAITSIEVTSSRDTSKVVTVNLIKLTGRHYIVE